MTSTPHKLGVGSLTVNNGKASIDKDGNIGVGSLTVNNGKASIDKDGIATVQQLVIKDKPIANLIRTVDTDVVVLGANLYSAKMMEKRLSDEMKDLDDHYLRKDKEDNAQKLITFEEGITVYEALPN